MNKRIILTGAQGTGKTTVLNLFKEAGWPVITEVVRKLHKEQGIGINRDGNGNTQQMVFNAYNELLAAEGPYVSDRGLTDVVAYSTDALVQHKMDPIEAMKQGVGLVNFVRNNPDIVYIYFPIEFEVVNDGVRSVDTEYQKVIDAYIKSSLDTLKINYLTVHGTPEERYNQIMNFISR